MNCVAYQNFDSDAFGVPFFRVTGFRFDELADELKALISNPPVIIDAKVSSAEPEADLFLQQLGFRKVCMQFELFHDLSAAETTSGAVEIVARLVLPEPALREHVRHFNLDRFSLDAFLPRAGKDRLYLNWFLNSLERGHATVAHVRQNICTYKKRGDTLAIDLMSVLEKRQGIGKDLLAAILAQARRERLRGVSVVTACENEPAWRLYLACGFQVSRFAAAFHYVSLAKGNGS